MIFSNRCLEMTFSFTVIVRNMEQVSTSILEYSNEHWELHYTKVLSDDVDLEGDSQQDESNSFCSPGVKIETKHVHCIKKDALEDSTSSEDAVCEGSRDSLSDDSLVIGPISPDVTEKKEDSNSILHNAMPRQRQELKLLHCSVCYHQYQQHVFLQQCYLHFLALLQTYMFHVN